MTVKDLILELLECDLNKRVSFEYPLSEHGSLTGNFYNYEQADTIQVIEQEYGVTIGVE